MRVTAAAIKNSISQLSAGERSCDEEVDRGEAVVMGKSSLVSGIPTSHGDATLISVSGGEGIGDLGSSSQEKTAAAVRKGSPTTKETLAAAAVAAAATGVKQGSRDTGKAVTGEATAVVSVRVTAATAEQIQQFSHRQQQQRRCLGKHLKELRWRDKGSKKGVGEQWRLRPSPQVW